MNGTLEIEDVKYVDQRFREIAIYLAERKIPGTVWRVICDDMVYEFVCRGKKEK